MSTPPKVPDSAAPMKSYAVAGVGPALSEMLDDPIVRRLMARDGVTRETLEPLIQRVRRDRLAVQSVASQGYTLADTFHPNGRLPGEDPIRPPVA